MPDPIDTRFATPRPSDEETALLACLPPPMASSVHTPPPPSDERMDAAPGGPTPDYSLAAQNPALRWGPQAPQGIELAAIANVPETSRDDPSRAVVCPPYVLHAELAQGSSDVAYFAAYNREAKRTEYIVAPEAVEVFKANVMAFKVGANVTLMNGGPTRPFEKESLRAVDAVMHHDPGAAATHLARSWSDALTDPVFYAEMAVSSAIGSAGTLARERPALRLVEPVAHDAEPLATRVTARATGGSEPLLPVQGNLARAPAPVVGPVTPPLHLAVSNPHPAVRPPVPTTLATPVARPAVKGGAAGVPVPRLAVRLVPEGGARSDDPVSCNPYVLGYHRGNDAIHNTCADAMGNMYPGSDFVVAGKAFDGVTVFGELLEVKTGYPSQYRDETPERVFRSWVAEAKRDGDIATACGYKFVFAVADPDALDALRMALEDRPDIEVRAADQDECVR